MHDLQQQFRPEFINRLDDVIVFNPISKEAIRTIVDIQLKRVAQMLAEQKSITLKVTDEAKDYL